MAEKKKNEAPAPNERMVTEPSRLFQPSRLSYTKVDIDDSPDPDQHEWVFVKAVDSGLVDRFSRRSIKPDPDNHLGVVDDQDWIDGPYRQRALIGLCVMQPDLVTPMFPKSKDIATRLILAENWQDELDEICMQPSEGNPGAYGTDDPDELDKLPPKIVKLLIDAADSLSLTSAQSVARFFFDPLGKKQPSSMDGVSPPEAETPEETS